ncbi:MAG: site-specific integrase [Alphaproteobacteria bacterium]|nr:site-specific integrase [Alphaproteobacteria bacterium]
MQETPRKFEFTESRIAKLSFAPRGKRYTVRDASTKNLALRIGETGKIYYLIKNIAGRVMFVRLGDTDHMNLKDARRALSENMPVVDKGKNPNDEKRKIRADMTLKEFFEKVYTPRHSKLSTKPLSQKTNETLFRIQLAQFHNKKMLNITHTDIEIWHKTMGKKSIYRANRALALIRHMYNRALAWGLPDGVNPARGIEMFREKSRRRFLLPDEVPRFFNALESEENELFKNYIYLCLWCGQRRGNMATIKWSDVDFDRRVIYIADTKNNDPQTIVLADQPFALLCKMKAGATSDWVFPSPVKSETHIVDMRTSWRNFLQRAGIEDFRMHDLRRTYGSWLTRRATNETIIQQALGDKSKAAAAVYMQVEVDPVRASIQAAIDDMAALVKPKKKGKK